MPQVGNKPLAEIPSPLDIGEPALIWLVEREFADIPLDAALTEPLDGANTRTPTDGLRRAVEQHLRRVHSDTEVLRKQAEGRRVLDATDIVPVRLRWEGGIVPRHLHLGLLQVLL